MSECKHLNAKIKSDDLMGRASCPDCGQIVWVCDVFNNLLDEMRRRLEELKK